MRNHNWLKKGILILSGVLFIAVAMTSFFLLRNSKKEEHTDVPAGNDSVTESELVHSEPCPYCQIGSLETRNTYSSWGWTGKERDCEHGKKDTLDYYMRRNVAVSIQCTTPKCGGGHSLKNEEETMWSCGTKKVE